MSAVITGNEANVVGERVAVVAGWNGTSPVRLTTTAPHGWSTGEWIYTAFVGMSSIQDQCFKINVISTTVIELIGSTNDSTPTASGAGILNFSLSPAFTIPQDGDDLDANSILAALTALADRTQYLAGAPHGYFASTATGPSPVVTSLLLPNDVVTNLSLRTLLNNDVHLENSIANTNVQAGIDEAAIAANAAAIATLAANPQLLTLHSTNGSLGLSLSNPSTLSGTAAVGTSSSVLVGDRFEVHASGSLTMNDSSGVGVSAVVSIEASQNGGGYAAVPGASVTVGTPPGAGFLSSGWLFSYGISGVLTIASAGSTVFRMKVTMSSGGGGDTTGAGNCSFVQKLYR